MLKTIFVISIVCLPFHIFAAESELEQGFFTFAGYTDLTFGNTENASDLTQFKIAPIFLIQPSDRFHIEAEFELAANDKGETESEIEYLDLHYFVNDYGTLTFGKILLPFAHFGPHLHPSWINPLPTQPGIYGGHHGDGLMEGLVPIFSDVGVSYQHVFPISDRHRIFADAFVVNGPDFTTAHAGAHHDLDVPHPDDMNVNLDPDHDADAPHEEEHEAAPDHEEEAEGEHLQIFDFALPELEFEGRLHDNNGDKARGGRLAYAYLPGFELGVSYYQGAYDNDNKLEFRAESVDITWSPSSSLTFRGEYIKTRTDSLGVLSDDVLHDEDALHDDEPEHEEEAAHDDHDEEEHAEDEVHLDLVAPTRTLSRDGWYVQASWRLQSLAPSWLDPIEIVARHSRVNKISQAERWSLGVNYWLSSRSVVKFSFDTTKPTFGKDVNRFFIQISHGF